MTVWNQVSKFKDDSSLDDGTDIYIWSSGKSRKRGTVMVSKKAAKILGHPYRTNILLYISDDKQSIGIATTTEKTHDSYRLSHRVINCIDVSKLLQSGVRYYGVIEDKMLVFHLPKGDSNA